MPPTARTRQLDRLPAGYDVIVCARNYAHEPLLALPGQRPSIGAEGKQGATRFTVYGTCGVRRKTDTGDLRIGEGSAVARSCLSCP